VSVEADVELASVLLDCELGDDVLGTNELGLRAALPANTLDASGFGHSTVQKNLLRHARNLKGIW
jgi:hypothetical protein